MFLVRLTTTTSGMGGPLIFAMFAVLLCTVGGRPQSSDHRQVSRPVRPFSVPDSRESFISSERQSAQRPLQQNSHGEDPYRNGAHADQVQQSTISSHDRQRLSHEGKDRRRQAETPMWLPRTDTSSNQGRDPSAQSHSQHHRDNRGSAPQDRRGSAPQDRRGTPSRGHKDNSYRPLTRMGVVDVPTGEHTRSNNESISGAARRVPSSSSQPSNAMPTNTGEIVFPGPTRETNVPKGTPGAFAPQVGNMVPNCAAGSTFCESTDNYPRDYLENVLRVNGDTFKDFFGNDELNELTQRIDLTDESPLCPSVEQVVYPKMAQNKEEKWLFVVNQDPYVQGVRVEKCLRQETECSWSDGFPLGYKTICRQKYIYRRMLALNEEGKTHSDMFRLPSCCACFVKSVGASGSGDGSR